MATIPPSELKSRCYPEREAPRLWVAIVMHFNLAAQGETFEELKGKLDAMFDDVREAWDGTGKPQADALLKRRAPPSYWLPFRWIAFRRRIRRPDNMHRPSNGRLSLVLTP
jgi:hypothetical protein